MARLRLVRHATGPDLLADAGTFLETHEAEHNLLLGACATLDSKTIDPSRPPYLAHVSEGDSVVLVVAQAPPQNFVLSCSHDLRALDMVVADLCALRITLPGAIGPPDMAAAFAERWSRANGVLARVAMEQRIHALTEVTPPRPTPGVFRTATPDDAPLLRSWGAAFIHDAGLPPREAEGMVAHVDRGLAAGSFYVWDDDGPVSMAASMRRTRRGAGVSLVYTPPAWRGRGYASACVAALSQRLLDEGRAFCFLYTDRANPTSNRIYASIGYRAVADSTLYSFVHESATEPPGP